MEFEVKKEEGQGRGDNMPAAEMPGRQEDKELSVACADVAFLANQRDRE